MSKDQGRVSSKQFEETATPKNEDRSDSEVPDQPAKKGGQPETPPKLGDEPGEEERKPHAKRDKPSASSSPSTPDDTTKKRQVIAVSSSKGPAAFFSLARKFLVTDESCDLSALEGAIVAAVDAAHLLERSKLATIVRYVTRNGYRLSRESETNLLSVNFLVHSSEILTIPWGSSVQSADFIHSCRTEAETTTRIATTESPCHEHPGFCNRCCGYFKCKCTCIARSRPNKRSSTEPTAGKSWTAQGAHRHHCKAN